MKSLLMRWEKYKARREQSRYVQQRAEESGSYLQGHSEGYVQGAMDGYSKGKAEGLDEGFALGYNEGEAAGYKRGIDTAKQAAIQSLIQGEDNGRQTNT